MTDTSVESATDLLRLSSELNPRFRFCFRGQPNAAWDLIPSAYRGVAELQPPFIASDAQWVGETERDVYRAYANESVHLSLPGSHTTWHALFVAQHFGVPTRLLDWTWNVLVAAYFASNAAPEVDGAVWCFDLTNYPFSPAIGKRPRQAAYSLAAIEHCFGSRRLNFLSPYSEAHAPDDSSTSFGAAGPSPTKRQHDSNEPPRNVFAVIEPPRLQIRLSNQQGLFSVHVADDDTSLVWNHAQHLRDVESRNSITLLRRFIVPAPRKERLLDGLARSGIDALHIFGDVHGLAESLRFRRAAAYRLFCSARVGRP